LFGFGPEDAPDLDNDGPMSSLTNNPSRNAYTVYVGYIFYGGSSLLFFYISNGILFLKIFY
jgi:hypothetical protein